MQTVYFILDERLIKQQFLLELLFLALTLSNYLNNPPADRWLTIGFVLRICFCFQFYHKKLLAMLPESILDSVHLSYYRWPDANICFSIYLFLPRIKCNLPVYIHCIYPSKLNLLVTAIASIYYGLLTAIYDQITKIGVLLKSII